MKKTTIYWLSLYVNWFIYESRLLTLNVLMGKKFPRPPYGVSNPILSVNGLCPQICVIFLKLALDVLSQKMEAALHHWLFILSDLVFKLI